MKRKDTREDSGYIPRGSIPDDPLTFPPPPPHVERGRRQREQTHTLDRRPRDPFYKNGRRRRMQLIPSLVAALLPVAAMAQSATYMNLATPLPPALAGTFNQYNQLSFSNGFADGNATCNVTYAAGAVTTATGGLETVMSLSGWCDVNGTLSTDIIGKYFKVDGQRLFINMTGSLSTVACGLSFQIGMANGVMGGLFTTATAPATPLPLCAYYNRLSASATNLATLNLAFFPGTVVGNGAQVGCAAERPAWSQMLFFTHNLTCSGDFGQPYNCINSPVSRCTNYSKYVNDIGIGMSVGGIGLLLVTLGCIIVIQWFHNKK